MIIDAVFKEEEALNADFGVLAKGEKGDKGDPDYSLVANALKGSASGNPIALSDVSPLPHEIAVHVDVNGAVVQKYGLNLFDSDIVFTSLGYVKQEDGTWLGKTSHGKSIKLPAQIKGSVYVQATAKNTGKKGVPFVLIAYYTDGTSEPMISLQSSHTEFTTLKKASDANKTVSYFMVSQGGANDAIAGAFYIRDVMISYADGEYEPYKKPEPITAEGGTLSIIGNGESMTLIAEDGVTISAEYNKDANKVINDIYQKLSALGAAVVNN